MKKTTELIGNPEGQDLDPTIKAITRQQRGRLARLGNVIRAIVETGGETLDVIKDAAGGITHLTLKAAAIPIRITGEIIGGIYDLTQEVSGPYKKNIKNRQLNDDEKSGNKAT